MVGQIAETPAQHQVEEIPGHHSVSRLIDLPFRYSLDVGLIWQKVFEFPRNMGESVVWRYHRHSIEEVHALGCDRQNLKRLMHPEKTPPWTYIGAITTHVQQVRAIVTNRGHGFVVRHKPYEDDGTDQGVFHAEISYRIKPDSPFNGADKTELKDLIQSVFWPLDSHLCA